MEDVPDEEMWAALEDENLEDAGEEGDDPVDSEDDDEDWDEPIAPGAMWPWELSDAEENLSDPDEDNDTNTESTIEGSIATTPKRANETATEVYRTPERQR